MKWFLYILGTPLAIFGTLWILQGINVIKGGMMGGHIQYALLGVFALTIGILLLIVASQRRSIAG